MSALAPTVMIAEAAIAQVKEIPGPDVAEWLGLPKARERHKWACVWCDSSDALEVYPEGGRGAHCFSCGKSDSVVGMVMAKQGYDFADAVHALAGRFGIYIPDTRDLPAPRAPRPPVAAPVRTVAPEVEAEAQLASTCREAIYRAVLDTLSLEPFAREYLAGRGFRGLDHLFAEDGFRSIDGRTGWARVWNALRTSGFVDEQIKAVLTPYRPEKPKPDTVRERYKLPWASFASVLVIPYRYQGRIVGLRFRKLNPTPRDKGDRYRDLGGRTPPMPFNADALDGCGEQELHVVEGELNAWTLAGENLRAIGLPGAQSPWRTEWTPLVRAAKLLVAWYDNDKGGHSGAGRLAEALQGEMGAPWLAERGRHLAPTKDANDLHREGLLRGIINAAPWR